MRDYKPNEQIIDRACELWVRMLRSPKFDNGDDSARGSLAMAMALMASKPSDEDTLELFRAELKKRLMNKFQLYESRPGEKPFMDWVTRMSVDYHPDKVLAEAAEAAGMETDFPWKTSMTVEDGHVSVRHGYGARTIYNYPCDRGWILTSLSGSQDDIDALVEFVNAGYSPNFVQVESTIAV